MSELPAQWAQVSIGDIAESMKNGVYKPAEAYSEDGIACLRMYNVEGGKIVWKDIKRMRLSKEDFEMYRLLPGDLLVNRVNSRELVGKAAMIPEGLEPCVFESKNIRLRLLTKLVEPKFVAFKLLLDGSRHFANNAQQVVGMASISQPQLAAFPLPLPPLAEQKRIVAKIEELFSELEAGEESLRVARRQLGVYRQSLLKQAFEGKLTAQWRTQNPAQLESPAQLLTRIQSARQARYEQQLKDWETALSKWEKGERSSSKPRRPSIPEGIEALPTEILNDMAHLPSSWLWGRLGSMTLGVEYGTAAKSSETGACPVIRMGNLQGGEIEWEDLVFTSDETEIADYRLAPGDVLFNRTNSPELVGKTAIYRGNRPAVFAGYLIRVNQISKVICSGYLNYFLNSGVAREYGNSVKTDGVNQSNINGAKLAGYPFPYCSLPEQQEIVRLLDEQFEVIERNEREIDAALQRSAALRQAILKKAFTGHLVPQDPADEPASALLARLRAGRASDAAPASAKPLRGLNRPGRRVTSAR